MGKRLRVGFNRDFYPLAHGDARHASGIIVDIAKSAFARAEYSVDFVPCSLDNLSRHFANGEIQAFAGIAITDGRRHQVIFSAPLIDSGGAWFRLGESDSSPRSAATPSAGPLLGAIESDFPDIQVQGVQNYRVALEKVVAGEVEAAALNVHVGRHQAARDFPGRFLLPNEPFLPLQLGVAFEPATDLDLIRAFDNELKEMQSGEGVAKVIHRYADVRE